MAHLRFHVSHAQLHTPFGTDTFGRGAEGFARFFGTPRFLVAQSFIVAGWIVANALGTTSFDPYPFILLNLAFSLQAAYAAPLILLAQTRQADRDKAMEEADARHREELAKMNLDMLKLNTEVTEQIAGLARRIDQLTAEIHSKIVSM